MQRAPGSLLALIRRLSQRLRVTTEQMTDTVDLPAGARVARARTHLAGLRSRADAQGLHIELQRFQREPDGLTRESINKHLPSLRDAGAIRISGQDITIVNAERLRAFQTD